MKFLRGIINWIKRLFGRPQDTLEADAMIGIATKCADYFAQQPQSPSAQKAYDVARRWEEVLSQSTLATKERQTFIVLAQTNLLTSETCATTQLLAHMIHQWLKGQGHPGLGEGIWDDI